MTRESSKSEGFIVSLTSTPARFGFLHRVLSNLNEQSVQPREIHLNIPRESYSRLPDNLSAISPALKVYQTRDLGPATKLLPTLARNRELPVITLDDDADYPLTLLESLWSAHKQFPSAVIAKYCKLIPAHHAVRWIPYRFWPIVTNYSIQPARFLLPIGAEGVLYPPGSLPPSYFNEKELREISYRTDDLWNWAHLSLGDTAVVSLPLGKRARRLEGSISTGLWELNRKKYNSENFRQLLSQYQLFGQMSFLRFVGVFLRQWVTSLPTLAINAIDARHVCGRGQF